MFILTWINELTSGDDLTAHAETNITIYSHDNLLSWFDFIAPRQVYCHESAMN